MCMYMCVEYIHVNCVSLSLLHRPQPHSLQPDFSTAITTR